MMECKGGEVTEKNLEHLKYLEDTCQYPPRLKKEFVPVEYCGPIYVTVRGFNSVNEDFFSILLEQKGIDTVVHYYILCHLLV